MWRVRMSGNFRPDDWMGGGPPPKRVLGVMFVVTNAANGQTVGDDLAPAPRPSR